MIFEKMKRKHIIFNYPTYTHASYIHYSVYIFLHEQNKLSFT